MKPLLRVTGTTLVIAAALITPVLATATGTPASADTVINGCTIVSSPTPSNFTNCPGANLSNAALSGVDLSYANLSGASFSGCTVTPSGAVDCVSAELSGANLTDADLSGGSFFSCVSIPGVPCVAADLNDANLTSANLSNASLAGCVKSVICASAGLSGATLTDANLTDIGCVVSAPGFPSGLQCLVPTANLFATTNGTGAVVTWSTPQPLPGATPGPCSPPSGSTFSLGVTTVTCQVLDAYGDVATATFQVNVAPTFFMQVVLPADGATLAGAPYLDALAADGPGVTQVQFEVSGGPSNLSDQLVATATPTYYGWLAKWNTTSVPNGTYTLQSVATDADNNTDTSTPVSIAVNNQPPATAVFIPSAAATVTGTAQVLDASAASAAGIASVTFEVSGGPSNVTDQVVGTATPTIYGYIFVWNTTTVPNGTYNLQSVATDTVSETTPSAPVTIMVNNPPPSTTVLIPSSGAMLSGTAALLDAGASPGVTGVSFELTGGTLTNKVIGTGTPTLYGWLAQWNTTSVPDDTYALTSVASYAGGVNGSSSPITIIVSN